MATCLWNEKRPRRDLNPSKGEDLAGRLYRDPQTLPRLPHRRMSLRVKCSSDPRGSSEFRDRLPFS